MGQERAGAEWQSSNNSRYNAAECRKMLRRRNVLLFIIVQIQYVMECLKSNTTQVRNIKQYLLATLYNAPTTIDSYYAAQVRHDFGWGGRSN